MADRPMIFGASMVRALLNGRKTQTRRLVKIPAVMGNLVSIGEHEDLVELDPGEFRRGVCHYASTGGLSGPYQLPCAVGDRLWAREAWAVDELIATGARYYATDAVHELRKKRSPIHMPRWASRLTLHVTDVRVQRLCDISEDDAIAEGFAPGRLDDGFEDREIGDGWTVSSSGTLCSAAGMFLLYWQKLHPDWDGYDSPWVAAITFDVEGANIDAARPAAPRAGGRA